MTISLNTMADVRALLREERASRRINHPQATYSTAGTLICLTCHIQIKAESLWEKHLRSPHHNLQLQRKQDEKPDRLSGAPSVTGEPEDRKNTSQNTKKRKADMDEEPIVRTKKAKAADGNPDSFYNEETPLKERDEPDFEPQNQSNTAAEPSVNLDESTTSQSNLLPTPSQPSLLPTSPPSTSTHTTSLPTRSSPRNSLPTATIDEDEWAAFEREIAAAATPQSPVTGTASALLASAGTITAAPLSAAEIAAQAREEAELAQTKTDDAEAEAEKEEAERRLEDEFEEMAGLDERVRILKEKREALRRKGAEGEATGKTDQVDSASKENGEYAEGGEGLVEEVEDEKERRSSVIEAQDEGKKVAVDDGGGGEESSSDEDEDETDVWYNWRR